MDSIKQRKAINSAALQQLLRESNRLELLSSPYFLLDDAEFERHRLEVANQHPAGDIEARAAYRVLTSKASAAEKAQPVPPTTPLIYRPLTRKVLVSWSGLLILGTIVLLYLLFSTQAHGQTTNVRPCVANAAAPTYAEGSANFASCDLSGALRVSGSSGGGVAQTQVRNAGDSAWVNVGFNVSNLHMPVDLMNSLPSGTNVIGHIICDSGCGGAASFLDSSAFTFGTTAVNNISAVVDDVGTNTVAENSAGAVRMNGNRILYIDLSKTVANTNKLLVTADPITFASAQAVTSTQLPGALDGSGFLKVHEQGTATVSGTVTANAGTGNFTVVQGTGTNLHAVIDSGSITATQGTGTNLHTVVDSGSITASGTVTSNQGTAAASTAGWPVTGGNIAETTAAWTNATAQNTTLRLTVTGYNSVVVFLNQGSTITGGVVTFEISDTTGFTNAYAAQCVQVQAFTTGSTYTLQQSVNQAYDCDVSGAVAFQVRLSSVITGTGTVNVGITANAMPTVPEVTVGGTVAATQSTSPWVDNVSQFGGTNISTGTGAGGAGIPRVTISNDSSLAANQSVNVAQINGITPLMGNGATGTGSHRTTIASDNSAIANWGLGATASAVPSGAQLIGMNANGNMTAPILCDNTAVYDASTNGKTTLVALSSTKVIYVCGFSLAQSTTSAVTVSLGSGTGTNCATTYTAKTPGYVLQAPTSTGPIGLVVMAPNGNGLKTAASENLCISTNAAVSVQALVWYSGPF